MLTKDLLRVSRAGGGYRPQFVGRERRPLAARVIGAYEGHLDEPREALDAALEALESDADDFKLVRGFAALCERDAAFETDAPLPPERVRRTVFEAAETVGVGGAADRERAVTAAANRLAVEPAALEASLYADRKSKQVLSAFEPRWDPDELIEQYNLSLAQTALFDATEVRIRSADPRALVSAVKRLRLMYELEKTAEGRALVVTGPDALFRRTRRYGTGFARLLRTVAKTADWELEAAIDDNGRTRTLTLSAGDVSVPGVDPVAEPTYDSGVESDFAARFAGLDLDWDLVREPEPLETGARVMIPDFAFDYRPPGSGGSDASDQPARIFFEVMGFWTPEYVEKKLAQIEGLEAVELVVAVDESLGVGEELAARDARVVPYSGTVRVKDVVDVLREYEADLVADAAAELPDELRPADDAITLADLAADHGVAVDVVESKSFPEHERVGRTLVRPAVLEDLRGAIEAGMSLSAVEEALSAVGIDESSAVLSTLGYRVEWEGLSGGTVRARADE
ncbi:DUF790 family protein [Haloferacaceae archaeon DSL9]